MNIKNENPIEYLRKNMDKTIKEMESSLKLSYIVLVINSSMCILLILYLILKICDIAE